MAGAVCLVGVALAAGLTDEFLPGRLVRSRHSVPLTVEPYVSGANFKSIRKLEGMRGNGTVRLTAVPFHRQPLRRPQWQPTSPERPH
jgi:hypothetical protein